MAWRDRAEGLETLRTAGLETGAALTEER